jgi:hypothetical protein
MNALGLYKRAILRGAQWRYLLLFVVGTLLPAYAVLAPVHGFLKPLLDTSTREPELVSSLDSPAFFEILRQSNEPGVRFAPALLGALLLALLIAPALAGAAAVVATAGEGAGPVRLRDLLEGAGSYYPRMLRMALVSLLPLGVASALAAGAFKLADHASAHATLESAATRDSLLAGIGATLLVWLATSTVEVGRAVLVAEPERRSAIKAWWRGTRLLVRRPGQVLGVCGATTVLALLLAVAFTAVRLRMPVSGPVMIAIELLVAQAAVAAIGWGRASRIAGLVEVARDAGTRSAL